MTISIVIPVYNVKPYLERCVQSVLCQTYKDLEVILVDDGSTDGSGALCDTIASIDQRICVVHQKNQGLSGARNTGIQRARGEYIAFLDSDDEWLLSDGLERLIQMGNADLIAFKRVDIWGKDSRIASADYDTEKINRMSDTQTVFSFLVNTQQLQISACFLLVRRQILLDYDIFFPSGMISEDLFWNFHLWQHLTSVKFANLDLYGYYHREGSITTSPDIRYYHSYDQIFTYWKAQCDEGCTNAEAIRIFLANMWVSRGYAYHFLNAKDKPEALHILKKHSDLLSHGSSPKSKRTRRMVNLIGVKATAVVLGWYWQLRSFVTH